MAVVAITRPATGLLPVSEGGASTARSPTVTLSRRPPTKNNAE